MGKKNTVCLLLKSLHFVEAMEGDDRRLSANSAALFEDGPRRAEQIRAASNRAFSELDTDNAVRRALVGRVRHLFFLDSLCIIGGILARRLFPRGCRCH